jgi:Tol biopolymer transport system component
MQTHDPRASIRWGLPRGGLAGLLLVAAAEPLHAQRTARASVGPAGAEGNAMSWGPSVNQDGRLVAFSSFASNFTLGDFNGASDVFVRDYLAGVIDLVSQNNAGAIGNGDSEGAHVAANAPVVAFSSDATNLSFLDVNGTTDVYARDLAAPNTMLVSERAGVVGNSASFHPAVSGNGRFVAFASLASNLAPADFNGVFDVFVKDLATGFIACLTYSPATGMTANEFSEYPSISASGRWIAFESAATDLVPGDTNGFVDVFVADLTTGALQRISRDPLGMQADGDCMQPRITQDGRYVTYETNATNLVAGDVNGLRDIVLFDRTTLQTVLVSQSTLGDLSDSPSYIASVSDTGRWVSFHSDTATLVPADMNLIGDTFIRDTLQNVTFRASLCLGLNESAGVSYEPAISGDGRTAAWASAAADQVPNDFNAVDDVFVRTLVDAQWGNYGAGYAGTNGVPDIDLTLDPVLGLATELRVENSSGAASVCLVFGGFAEALIPTPWGGDILIMQALTFALPIPMDELALPFDVPHDEQLEGLDFYLQALQLDPGAAAGVSFTRGLHLQCGW